MAWYKYVSYPYTSFDKAVAEYNERAEDYPEEATGYVYYLDDYIGNDYDGTDTLMQYHYYPTKKAALEDLAAWGFDYDWTDDTQAYYRVTVYKIPVSDNDGDMFEVAERCWYRTGEVDEYGLESIRDVAA